MVQIPTEIPITDENLLGRKKETRIYYRPHKNPNNQTVWIPTLPLLADPWHTNYYAKKGFKLWPPGKEPGQEDISEVELDTSKKKKVTMISCPEEECAFVAKSYLGLARHMSSKHGIK